MEGQKEKIDRQRKNEKQSSSKLSPKKKKKIQEKKKVWHKKLLTATFYSAFGQRTEHLTKR